MSAAPMNGADPKLLLSVPLKFLNDADLAELLKSAEVRTLEKDEGLMPKGVVPTELHIPVSGQLLQVSLDVEEGEQIPPYEPVGLECLLNDQSNPAMIVAAEETRVYSFPWDVLRPILARNLGLENYLRLVSGSSVVRELDLTLSEMGCSPRFRAELLGSMRRETLTAGTWLLTEGETPTSIFYAVEGTIRAYTKVGPVAIKPLWIVPNMTWQLWDHCVEARPNGYLLKATSEAEIFKLSAALLKALKARSPEDYAAFARMAAPPPPEFTESAEAAPPQLERPEPGKIEELLPPQPRPVRRSATYPFVAQADPMDGGPACLAMVSRHYGRPLASQFFRGRMHANHQGVTLFDLAEASEKCGFASHGLEVADLTQVESSVFPLVAERGGRFVVVYALSGSRVVVGDPASGVKRMALDEFKRGFEGHVLVLRPTHAFYGQAVPAHGYAHYIEAIEGSVLELSVILGGSLLLALLGAMPALMTQFIIDQVLAKKDATMLLLVVVGAATVAALIAMTGWLREYYIAHIVSRIDFGAASAFLRKLYTLPFHYFATRHVGDFTRRLTELENVRNFLTWRLVKTVLQFFNLAVYGALLFLYSPLVAASVFVSAPLLTLMSAAFSRALRRQYNETFVARSEQDGILADQVRGIAAIKTLSLEVAARWRYEEALVRTLKSRYRSHLMAATVEETANLVHNLLNYAILGLAAYLAIKGSMTAGQVVSITILSAGVIGPFHELSKMWSELQQVRTTLERLDDVFLAEPEEKPAARALSKQRLRGDIEFKDVWFRYGGESSGWILQGLSFRIQAGQRVAIVGPSGAGKSTVALLTARLYEPTKGQIFIDGRDYREYDRQWLRRHIGLLVQESDLFHGTIVENIAYGDPDPDLSRVEWATSMARAADFIAEKPGGYQYVLTHGGKGLSGGQKQRIAISRILYCNPTVLFLDEGTSALDPVTERQVLEALKRRSVDEKMEEELKRSAAERAAAEEAARVSAHERALMEQLEHAQRDRTLISIMHRYALVKTYDYIVVVNAGRVAEVGTHEELFRRGGLYAKLYSQDDS